MDEPGWSDRYRALADMQSAPFFSHLGASFTAAGDGWAELAIPASPVLANPYGIPHGGVWLFLADSAMGGALGTLVPYGDQVITVQFDFRWLRAAGGDRLTATATVLRRGRQASHCAVELKAPDGTVLGVGSGTYVVLPGPGSGRTPPADAPGRKAGAEDTS